eukprot:6116797-Pleurochrysis_carterae.AAC.3
MTRLFSLYGSEGVASEPRGWLVGCLLQCKGRNCSWHRIAASNIVALQNKARYTIDASKSCCHHSHSKRCGLNEALTKSTLCLS